MKNKIIKLEKERLVKQFPSKGEKPARGKTLLNPSLYRKKGWKSEKAKHWSVNSSKGGKGKPLGKPIPSPELRGCPGMKDKNHFSALARLGKKMDKS
jgi:hypothetical protein